MRIYEIMSIANWLVLRRNTDGSIDPMRLPEAVSVLAGMLSAETYESRMSIAAALVVGKTITANGCTYRLEPKRLPKAKGDKCQK